MSEPLPPLPQVWDAAVGCCEADADTDAVAAFGAGLLRQLRGKWESQVRVTTSHWDLIFTRPTEHPFRAGQPSGEQVVVRIVSAEQVEMSLSRAVPRRGESQAAGHVMVAGDFTRPGNALPAVEALLHQLAVADDE